MRGVQMRLGSTISFIGREALRIVLPSFCVVCRRDLPWRDRSMSCCGACWRSLPRIDGAKCRTCALPLPAAGEDTRAPCISCSTDEQPLTWCDSWGEYRDGLERVLHAFKFERHDFLATPLAHLMRDTLRERDFDAVVPVPMHPKKRRKRGYNQAELLAVALAESIAKRADASLLTKTVERETQSTLARAERASNVRNTFAAAGRVEGRSILLVDDVCTTGETLRACARALLDAGASRVSAITVAKAV
jgi:ComF family protein